VHEHLEYKIVSTDELKPCCGCCVIRCPVYAAYNPEFKVVADVSRGERKCCLCCSRQTFHVSIREPEEVVGDKKLVVTASLLEAAGTVVADPYGVHNEWQPVQPGYMEENGSGADLSGKGMADGPVRRRLDVEA